MLSFATCLFLPRFVFASSFAWKNLETAEGLSGLYPEFRTNSQIHETGELFHAVSGVGIGVNSFLEVKARNGSEVLRLVPLNHCSIDASAKLSQLNDWFSDERPSHATAFELFSGSNYTPCYY